MRETVTVEKYWWALVWDRDYPIPLYFYVRINP